MLAPVLCPHCGHTLDHHTDAVGGGRSKPRPGDLGICVGCYAPLVFGDDLKLREATDDERASIPIELLEKLFVAKLLRHFGGGPSWPEETRQ